MHSLWLSWEKTFARVIWRPSSTMNVVIEKLYKDFEVLDTWLYENYMAPNPGKCNFMCLGWNLPLDEVFVYKNFKLKNTFVNEILEEIIDRELKFPKHVKHICKKTSNKLNALTRMANILHSFQIFHLGSVQFTAHFCQCFLHACQIIWLIKFKKEL